MGRIARFVMLLLTWTTSVLGQYEVSGIPDSLVQGAQEIVRGEKLEISIENERTAIYTVDRTVTVLHAQQAEKGIRIIYDPTTPLNDLELELYDATGRKIRTVKEKEWKDRPLLDGFSVYQDNRYKAFVLPTNSLPLTYHLKYEQEISGMPFAFLPDWYIQEFYQSVQKRQLELIAPEGFGLVFRPFNIELEATRSSSGRKQQWRWEVGNLCALKPEPYGPVPRKVLPYLHLAPKQYRVEKHEGSNENWEAFGKFMYGLYVEQGDLPKAAKEEVLALVSGINEPEDQIQLLYRFMQQRMRYVSIQLGIGGWQPWSPEYVYEKSFGDCKALSNFMRTLLKEVRIESYPVLIENTPEPDPLYEDLVASPFNHVILYVPQTNQWLECTSSTYPPGYIGMNNSDRKVLLLTPEGGKIARTPTYPTQENRDSLHAVIELQADGSAMLEINGSFKGETQEYLRYLNSQLEPAAIEKRLRPYFSNLSMHRFKFEIHPSADQPEVELKVSAQIPNFSAKAGKRLFIPINALQMVESIPAAVNDRTQPVVVYRDQLQQLSLTIVLPDVYRLEALPDPSEPIRTEFGHYTITVDSQEKSLLVSRSLIKSAGEWSPEAYGAFRDFFLQAARLDQQKAVLVQE